MDTSETYIKMCDCEEIQNIRHAEDCVDRNEWWQSGDYVYTKDAEYVFNVCGVRHCVADTGYFSDKDSIWLPRQDQLQEMVRGKHESTWQLIVRLWKWWVKREAPDRNASMEQLWLAFVMKEKNKTWNGEKWQKRQS